VLQSGFRVPKIKIKCLAPTAVPLVPNAGPGHRRDHGVPQAFPRRDPDRRLLPDPPWPGTDRRGRMGRRHGLQPHRMARLRPARRCLAAVHDDQVRRTAQRGWDPQGAQGRRQGGAGGGRRPGGVHCPPSGRAVPVPPPSPRRSRNRSPRPPIPVRTSATSRRSSRSTASDLPGHGGKPWPDTRDLMNCRTCGACWLITNVGFAS
jgi:hypothetical protein